jgi:hypothetical protein
MFVVNRKLVLRFILSGYVLADNGSYQIMTSQDASDQINDRCRLLTYSQWNRNAT